MCSLSTNDLHAKEFQTFTLKKLFGLSYIPYGTATKNPNTFQHQIHINAYGIASKKHRVSELLIHTGQRDHKQYLKSTQKSQIHTSSLIFQFHKPLCIHTKRAFLSVSTHT